MAPQTRVAAGVPTGGQFASTDRPESTASLSPFVQKAAAFAPGTYAALPEYWEAVARAQAVIDAPPSEDLSDDERRGYESVRSISIEESRQSMSYLAHQFGHSADLAEDVRGPYRTAPDAESQRIADVQWNARAKRLREIQAALLASDADAVTAAHRANPELAAADREWEAKEAARPKPTVTVLDSSDDISDRIVGFYDDFGGNADAQQLDLRPESPVEVRRNLDQRRDDTDTIRSITLNHAACEERADGNFDIHGHADGRPMNVFVSSGLPRLQVRTGRPIIHADSSWGNSITVHPGAHAMVVTKGAKTTINVKPGGKVTVVEYDVFRGRTAHIYLEDHTATADVYREPKPTAPITFGA